MDFADKRGPGAEPVFGAIFMSNSETRMECFKRQVFGVQISLTPFVKQASSDGAFNIVPHAFRSSGKYFPAQVRFTTIWNCDPLSEYEFRDVIKDNYFTTTKFKFGLSEEQVRHLLLLFSKRKLKQSMPSKQPRSMKVSKPPVEALRNVRPVADNEKYILSDMVKNRNDKDVAKDFEPVYSNEYSRYSTGKARRLSDVENDAEHTVSTEYSKYSMGKERRSADTENDREPVIYPKYSSYSLGEKNKIADNDSLPTNSSVGNKTKSENEYPRHALIKENIFPDDRRFASSYKLGKKRYTTDDIDPYTSRKQPGYFYGQTRNLTYEDRYMENYEVENNFDVNNGGYRGNYSCDVKRLPDVKNVKGRFGYDHNLDLGLKSDIFSRYPENSLGEMERVADDGRLRTSCRDDPLPEAPTNVGFGEGHMYARTNYRVENKCEWASDIEPTVLSKFPGRYPSDLPSTDYPNNCNLQSNDARVYLRYHNLEINDPFVQERIPSDFSHSVKPKISKLSYSNLYGDSINSSCIPYDPDAPSIQYEWPSSFGVNLSPNYVKEISPSAINDFRNRYSSIENQSIQPPMQRNALSQHQYDGGDDKYDGGVEKYVPSAPVKCKCTNCVAGISTSRDGYIENKTVTPADNVERECRPFLNSSLASIPTGRNGDHGFKGIGIGPSLSVSPKEKPSFVPDVGYPFVSDEKYEQETPWHETNKALTSNVRLPNRNQDVLSFLESCRKNSNRTSGLSHNDEYYRASQGVDSDGPKKRNSVFSRLSVEEQKNDIHMGCNEDDIDISVDEIMSNLHRGHNFSVKKLKKFNVYVRPVENVEKSKDKRPATFLNPKTMNDSVDVKKQMEINHTSSIEESFDVIDQGRPIVDFKRRSEVRKKDNQNGKASSSNQPKRRKLVRPVFGNNNISNDKGNCDVPFLSSSEISVVLDNTDKSEGLLKNQAHVHSLSQLLKSDANNQTGPGENIRSSEDLNCEAKQFKEEVTGGGNDLVNNKDSKCESQQKSERCEVSLRNGVEKGQVLLHNGVIENMPVLSSYCEVKNSNTDGDDKNMVKVYLPDLNKTCSSDEETPSLKII